MKLFCQSTMMIIKRKCIVSTMQYNTYLKKYFTFNKKRISVCLCTEGSRESLNRYGSPSQFLIGPGKVYKYFVGEYHHTPKRNHPFEKMPPPKKIILGKSYLWTFYIKINILLLEVYKKRGIVSFVTSPLKGWWSPILTRGDMIASSEVVI